MRGGALMNIRKSVVLFVLVGMLLALSLTAFAGEGQTAVFGANSTRGGSISQVNNGGLMSYAKITSVAPIVNRIRIVNMNNNSVVFDGCPLVGATLYMPRGSYLVTGWSAYGTEDGNAVVALFTQAPDPAATPQDAKPAQQPATVNGNAVPTDQNTIPLYNNNNAGLYYPYPNYGIPAYLPVPRSQFMWCNACGKYHVPGGCAFTVHRKSALDPYDPYWRGNK